MRPLTRTGTAEVVPFAFAGAGHALSAALEPVREVIAADPGLRPSGVPGEVVRADLRVAPAAGGSWCIERMYWSVQRSDADAAGGLRGRLLLVDRRRGRPALPTVHDFPDDPRLPAAARADGPLLAGHGGAPVRVLRYIPLGRITFRTAGSGTAAPVIGKIKGPRSLERAQERLGAVRAAAAGATFAVPVPLSVDADHHVLFQTLCPGSPLAEVAGAATDEGALRRLGAVHREIHALEVAAPPADEDQLRAQLRADADWIGLAAPEQADAAARVRAWLEAHLRWCAEGERRFCHGDYSPAQVLCAGEAWSVVDFDDAHRGDPYADVAATLVSLEHEFELDAAGEPGADAAATAAAAERRGAAYLAGYGDDLDAERLLAHRVAAQIGLLARRLRKDRTAPGEPADVLAGLLAGTGA